MKAKGNQQAIFEVIKQFTGKDNIIAVSRPFVDYMGSIEGGLFLSQLLYWSDKGKNPSGYIYKTYKEWYQELRLSKYQVMKASKICEQRNFLKTKIKKANGNPTVHYKLNYNKFIKGLVKFLTIDSEETSLTITESTNIEHRNIVSLGPEWDRIERREDEAENYEHDRMTATGITPL